MACMNPTRTSTSASFAEKPRNTPLNERPSSLERLLSAHRRVALDSNVLVYLVEGDNPRAESARRLLDELEVAHVDIVFATIGLTEVLAGPARAGVVSAFERLAAELHSAPLRFIPLSAEIAEDTGWLRGGARLDLADSVHLASARAAGATVFITNDRHIAATPQLDVVYLDDLVA